MVLNRLHVSDKGTEQLQYMLIQWITTTSGFLTGLFFLQITPAWAMSPESPKRRESLGISEFRIFYTPNQHCQSIEEVDLVNPITTWIVDIIRTTSSSYSTIAYLFCMVSNKHNDYHSNKHVLHHQQHKTNPNQRPFRTQLISSL